MELVEAVDSEEGASEEQKKEWKTLEEKRGEIEDYLEESDFSRKAFKKCPKYETIIANKKIFTKTKKVFR